MDLKTSLMHLQCELVAERALVNPKNITWLQYDILLQLSKEKEILPSTLSTLLGIPRTKLSKALKELKSSGYIQQSPNPADGRELTTSMTQDGINLLTNITTKHTALYATAKRIMTQEEQDTFTKLAEKLTAALKEERLVKQKK